TVNGDFGWEAGEGDPTFNGGNTALWYGAAGYASYKLCPSATLNSRVEWFDDEDGTRIGAPGPLYEVTFGVAIKPLPDQAVMKNLTIRPEVRVDYCDKAFFDAGSDHYQWTLAVDAIFAY